MPSPEVKVDAEDEIALLELAQSALKNNPALSEAQLLLHKKKYPYSVYASEREMLLIEAKMKEGKVSEAKALAQKWLSADPSGKYSGRLREVVSR